MATVQWRIKEFLKKHKISAASLERKAGIGTHRISKITRGDGSKLVDRDNLAKIIAALREMTGENVQISDLLEYVED